MHKLHPRPSRVVPSLSHPQPCPAPSTDAPVPIIIEGAPVALSFFVSGRHLPSLRTPAHKRISSFLSFRQSFLPLPSRRVPLPLLFARRLGIFNDSPQQRANTLFREPLEAPKARDQLIPIGLRHHGVRPLAASHGHGEGRHLRPAFLRPPRIRW